MIKYQIRADGEVLADLSDKDYAYFNGVLSEELNAAGTLTFTLMPQNPVVDSAEVISSKIVLYRDGAPVWVGRPIKKTINVYNQVTVVCEGALSFLGDVILAGDKTYSGSAESVIKSILSDYNSACTGSRKITAGYIATGETVSVSGSNVTPFELLNDIVDSVGGYYNIFYDSDVIQLSYSAPAAFSQDARWGRNIIDISSKIDATKIITRLIAEGDNGLVQTVQNMAAADKYGIVDGYKRFSGVSTADALSVAANAYLSNNILKGQSIDVSAVDLSLTDKAEEPFAVGKSVRVVSAPHGVDTTLQVVEVDTNLNNPADSKIVLGAKTDTLTKSLIKGGVK